MLIQLQTDLPDDARTLRAIKNIIKVAILNNVYLDVKEWGDKSEISIMALNNVILETISKEIEQH